MHAPSPRPRPARAADPLRRPLALIAATIAAAGAMSAPGPSAGAQDLPSVEPIAPAAALVPVEPCRLLDTRDDPARPIASDGAVDIAVAGRCGVAADAVAAAITVTAVRPDGPGYLTAYPAGDDVPATSTLNHRARQIVANGAIVALGEAGAITVAVVAETHVVVDVTAFFAPAPEEGVAAGRFVGTEPRRLVDTRETARPAPGASVVVAADVPDDAIAVAVNLTTTATTGADFFTAHASGADRPLASVLNVDGPSQARAASAIVPVADGEMEVFTREGSHVIVDLVGYFTGEAAEVGTDGLFVATRPTRLLDTRRPVGPAGGPRLWDRGARELPLDGYTAGGAAAIVANVTMTRTEDAGHVVVHAAGDPTPATSSVNASAAQSTVANLAIVPVSTRGITARTHEATHLVVDATGWFTGTPRAAGDWVAVNEPPGDRRVVIIADSTMAGMRWNGTLDGLQGMRPVTRLESCRRLVSPSCRGREGYAPPSLVGELVALGRAGPEDILVIGAGYDDWHSAFSADFDTVVATARRLGYRHIVWPTYLSDVGYYLPGGGRSNYGEMNRILYAKVASGRYPEVRIWDFDGYTADAVGWFYADGIHETTLGSWGVADWISRHVRAFDDRPCAQPWAPGEEVPDPCPDPDDAVVERGLPDIAGLYP